MKIIEFEDKEQLGKEAAALIARTIASKPDAVLSIATGGTPLDTYQELIHLHQAHQLSFKQTKTVNLDEYAGLDPDHENSYMTYMKRHLFDHIDLPQDQYFLPNGAAPDLEKECLRYDQLIQDIGGIDLQLLGIGQNGHIGFNEPGTPFNSKTHVVQLDENTREQPMQDTFLLLIRCLHMPLPWALQAFFQVKRFSFLHQENQKRK